MKRPTAEPGRTTADEARRVLLPKIGLTVPARPRFVRGVVTIPLDGGYLFEGTAEPVVLKGAASAWLPAARDLLDGGAGAEDLADRLGITRDEADAFLSLLYSRGLLEDGADEPSEVDPASPAGILDSVTYLSRMQGATRVTGNAEQALRALTGLRAVVVCPTVATVDAPTRAWFAASGVDLVPDLAGADLDGVQVLGCLGGGDLALESDVDTAARTRGVPWLRAAAYDRTVEVGPFFDAARPPCHACFASQYRAGSAAAPDPATTAYALAAVLTELQARATRVGRSVVHPGYLRVDLAAGRTHRHAVAARHPCAATTGVPVEISAGRWFAAAVATQPLRLFELARMMHNYQPWVYRLAREEPHEYPTSPSVPLPVAGPHRLATALPAPAGPDEVSVDQLATLLACAVGGRPAQDGDAFVRRWSPSGGNLASPQVFLLVRRVPGIEPGCYLYHGNEHRLYRTSTDRPTTGPGADAPVLLVFTAALGKAKRKYGPFALKLVHQDAGAALLTAHLAAGHAGLDLSDVDPADWPDPAAPLLLDPRQNPVMAVLAVRPQGADRADV